MRWLFAMFMLCLFIGVVLPINRTPNRRATFLRQSSRRVSSGRFGPSPPAPFFSKPTVMDKDTRPPGIPPT
ncbi:unnamed protein product, partial [Mesorhabditis belari]|uniref:Uncharacterized protein n=1 Tax=Mesorhabditis belari TaxID=2138241 RepID=A0AAF3EAY3_9BILA